MTGLGAAFNGVTGGIFGGIMGAAGVKPLKADLVAEAVVEALDDESVKGPVEVKEIEELAQKAWRKGMLWINKKLRDVILGNLGPKPCIVLYVLYTQLRDQ